MNNNQENPVFTLNGNAVWQDVLTKEYTLCSKKKDKVRQEAQEYFETNPIDYAGELQKIKDFKADKAKKCSPLWQRFSANHSVKSKVDFNKSSTLEYQLKGIRDKDVTITDHTESDYVAAFMCCDTPESTLSFLFRTLMEEVGVSLGDRLPLSAELTRYVAYQFEVCFIYKWIGMTARPSQYEFWVNNMQKKTVSDIPHPQHPARPSGHSSVSQAVKKWAIEKYGIKNISIYWLDACDEAGLARIDAGIHYFADHDTAIINVEMYHEDALKYSKLAA